jgi:hypothetical protein
VLKATLKDPADQAAAATQLKADVVAATTPSTSSRWAILPQHRPSGTSPTKDAAACLRSRARAVR